jgi:hypothetical protein
MFALDGTPRPDWARLVHVRRRDLMPMNSDEWRKAIWPKVVERLASLARPPGAAFRLDAVAAIRLLR